MGVYSRRFNTLHNGLRTWCWCSCCLSWDCGSDLIPGPWDLCMLRGGQKCKKTKQNKRFLEENLLSLLWIPRCCITFMEHIILCLVWQLCMHATSLHQSFESLAYLYVLQHLASCHVYDEFSKYSCWRHQVTTLSSAGLPRSLSFRPSSLIPGAILLKDILPSPLCPWILQSMLISLAVEFLPPWLKYCFFMKAALVLSARRDSWLSCLARG